MNKSPARFTDILGKCILREWCVCAIWKRFPVTIWIFLVSGITPMINQTTMPRYHEPMCEFPFSLFIKLQYMTCICIWCLELLGIYLYFNSVIDSWARQVPHMCNVEWIYPLAQRYVFNNLPEILIWWNNFCWHKCLHRLMEILYILDWIYPFLKGIQKHNCNEISFDCYNHLVFMITGLEEKNYRNKNWCNSRFSLKKMTVQWAKIRVNVWYRNTMDKN